MNKKGPLEKLKEFLSELFQFESDDLDFGIHKILNYKRKEIKSFIDKMLVEKVNEQLTRISDKELNDLKNKVEKLEKDSTITGYLIAQRENPQEAEILYKYNKKKIDEYNQVKKLLKRAKELNRTEEIIYNHLTLFFSRYYDKGDFISKRRFGKFEKYVVPYNGEETFFHWANYDQYYIKSSEHFQHYAFKTSHLAGSLIVHFKLTEAQTEQGNVKESEKRFFVLSEKEAEFKNNELTVYFEYRTLTADEKKEFGNQRQQEKLNEKAVETLKQKLGNKAETKELWEERDDKSLLLRKLNHYTKKNTYDFFIHKDLNGFLQRELDYYIKSELVKVEDLYVLESEEHYERIRHNFKLIKVFKNIADTIIDFLAQIENFQKKLWEKKKFVLFTEWVITIDKLAAWLPKDDFEKIITEVLKNEKQIEEWKELFGEEILDNWEGIDIEDLKVKNSGQAEIPFEGNKTQWKKLPIDTIHFSDDFKTALLTALSIKINLEEETDGLVIHSDNFHGLTLLQEKFYEQVICIHIDPPYNTETSGFLYKNTYKHSCWLEMMEERIKVSLTLMSMNGSFLCHIDENEHERLNLLFTNIGIPDAGTIIWDKKNPMLGRKGIATQHEYILWRTWNDSPIYIRPKNVRMILSKAKMLITEHGGVDNEVRKEFANWIISCKELSGGEKAYRYIDKHGRIFRGVAMGAPEQRKDPKFHIPLIHPVTKKPCPIPPNGWSRTPETLQRLLYKDEIIFGEDETVQPQRKVFLTEDSGRQISSVIRDASRGKNDMLKLGLEFPYCHPISLYEDLLGASTLNNKNLVLDYFAGSGTTWHAAQMLNKEDGGRRKCILIEQGDYVYTVIIPRIKKIAYTFDWKDGKPKNGSMNGLGVFFKYQRLEQYEEALENIAITAPEEAQQKALQFDEYIPKYFLEFETRGSQTLVNIDEMENPWDYKLKVWNGFDYDTKKAVDLPETFNYLIGLHVQKMFMRKNEDKTYLFVWGNTNNGKKTLVIWRDIKGWEKDDFEKDANFIKPELESFTFDQLYINGQSVIENAQTIEEEFKAKMITG